MPQIKDTILKILEQFGIESEYITSMDMTMTQLGISSIEMVKIAIAIYDEYGIKLKLSKENDINLNKLCDVIAEKLSNIQEV